MDVAKEYADIWRIKNQFIHRDIADPNSLLTTKGPGRVVQNCQLWHVSRYQSVLMKHSENLQNYNQSGYACFTIENKKQ